jgi:hypothetical protein
MDLVKIPKEGRFDRCERCGMQVHPLYPRHQLSKECQVGVERWQQREAAVTAALTLCQQFMIHGNVLERVEVYKYLGQMMAQDDNDTQAVRAQLRKARATWLGLERSFGAKTRPRQLQQNFIWLSSKPLYYTAARRGLSLCRPWHDWWGSILGLRGAWHRSINRGEALGRSGCTQSQGTC